MKETWITDLSFNIMLWVMHVWRCFPLVLVLFVKEWDAIISTYEKSKYNDILYVKKIK